MARFRPLLRASVLPILVLFVAPICLEGKRTTTPEPEASTEAAVEKPIAEEEDLLPNIIASIAEYEVARKNQGKPGAPGSFFVCYKDMGCFSGEENFHKLPSTPEFMKTEFLLFTEAHQTKPDKLNYSDPASIQSSRFRSGQAVIFVVHGFGDSSRAKWYTDFQVAVLGRFPMANFIAVDWTDGAGTGYWQAATNTQMAGAQIARLLTILHNITGLQMAQVHLIGFSLGAHVVGSTSKKLEDFGLGRVGRITGLDPAGPIFRDTGPSGRLDETDADFVQIVHSNAGPLRKGAMGIDRSLGHRDFYPNGGDLQPGCAAGLHTMVGSFIQDKPNCNHNRAPTYVSESINSTCPYVGFPCDTYDEFLDGKCITAKPILLDIFAESPSAVDKPLYFQTHAEPYFCAHPIRIMITVSDKLKSSRKGALKVILTPKRHGSISPATTNLVLFKDTQFLPGKTYQEVIVSRMALADIEHATVEYQRSCLRLLCGDNKYLELSSFQIQQLNGMHSAQCRKVKLPHAEVVTVASTASSGLSECTTL